MIFFSFLLTLVNHLTVLFKEDLMLGRKLLAVTITSTKVSSVCVLSTFTQVFIVL